MIQNRLISVLALLVLCVVVLAQEPKTSEPPTTGAIGGKVVNESGQPLAGVTVYIRLINGISNRSTTTDMNGNFRVNSLEAGLYSVAANSPVYASPPSDSEAPNYYRIGDSASVELIRGGAITGTVTNAAGEPVISVRVRAILIRDPKGQPIKTPWAGFFEQSTDDRGVYRIFGLPPGNYVVSAGGSNYVGMFTPFEEAVPTFAPSSTRDTAAEITVRSGEDSTVDIRYRGEPGHRVSGTVKVSGNNNVNITLTRPGSIIPIANTFQMPPVRGFQFGGLADGEYDLLASEVIVVPVSALPQMAYSEPKRITIKGADITGIELVTKSLGSISGKILFEPTKLPECQGKRPPLLAETLVRFRRPDKDKEKADALTLRLVSGVVSPDAAGAFAFRNLTPGSYQFESRFYARYWYLQSISLSGGGAKPQRIDAAASWTVLKTGENLSNLTITLAEGAASIRGTVPVKEGEPQPAGMVYLVPNDKDKVDDVLRYFVTDIAADGTFTFSNLPPGRYLALTQTNVEAQIATQAKLRQPEAATARAKLRRTADAKKSELELKPCQNLADYQLKQ